MSLLDFITGGSTSEDVEGTGGDENTAGDRTADQADPGGRSRGRAMVLIAGVIAGLLFWRRRRS